MVDYKQLASLEAGRKTGEIDRAELADFLWQAHIAQAILNAASSGPDERAKAMCHWVLLYRFAHSTRNETERAELESLAAKAGITRLSFYLHQFAIDFGTTILVSPDPVTELSRILNGTAKPGPKERPFERRFEIAAAVEKLRFESMTLDTASKKVAETTRNPHIGGEAVRRVYEDAVKEDLVLVQAIAAGTVKF
jgi:hypothetical protein